MRQLRNAIIRTGLSFLRHSGIDRLLQPLVGGAGLILMLHHVRPQRDAPFQPNRHLEVTPEFLRRTLAHVRDSGLDIITLDEMLQRLVARDTARRFVCFTFDDGYRDNRDFALPLMRAFDAPFTVYVPSAFASGHGRLWWVALERVVAASDAIEAEIAGVAVRLDSRTIDDKYAAFARLHDGLRRLPDGDSLRRTVSTLCARHGIDEDAICRDLCLSWDELKPFAADPLVTIGAHTLQHDSLALQSAEAALHDITANRTDLETTLQRPVRHLAYPYGDRAAAASRDFALARQAGFSTAVTTRPGMIFPEHATHPTALPRVSLNGAHQEAHVLPVLTSGAATALWNGFRRLDVD